MNTANSLLDAVQDLAVESCWRQWAAIGAPVVSRHPPARSIVDPEALLLLSGSMSPVERRLVDVMASFAAQGATHVSTKRLAALTKAFPEESRLGLASFAHSATTAGDRRWKTFVKQTEFAPRARFEGGHWNWVRPMHDAPGLMLRLRAGFGHGTKTDALTFLLGRQGTPASVAEIAAAAQTSAVAVRAALPDMVLADLVLETRGRPTKYYVREDQWRDVLTGHPDAEPGFIWRNWADLFSFLAQLVKALESAADATNYVAASSVRDRYEAYRDPVVLEQVPLPEPDLFPGAAYLDVLKDRLPAIRAWFDQRL